MQRVCCVCGIEYGVKPPEGDRITHGLCARCLPDELKRIKKEMAAIRIRLTEVEQKNKYSGAEI